MKSEPAKEISRSKGRQGLRVLCWGGAVTLVLLGLNASVSVRVHAQGTAAAGQTEVAEALKLLRTGQPEQAKAKLDAAVRAAPRSADALTWRGICENQLQQYAAAAADFRAALRLNGALVSAHYNLALSLIRLHETDAAIEQLGIVTAAQPRVAQPMYNLAILLESKGSFAAAADHLSRAHALQPEDKGITLHLLLDNLRSDRLTGVPALVADLDDGVTPPEVQRQAGGALLEAGRFSEAVTMLQTAREREPGASGVDLLLARAEIGAGRNEDAIDLLEPRTEGSGDERAYLLALAYLGAGRVRQAAETFETAAKLDPEDARPVYHLGLITATIPQGQQEAVTLLRSATRLDPAEELYTLALARVLLATDQADEAKAILATTKLDTIHATERHTLLGVALAATHSVSEAVPELEMAVTKDPKLALAQNVLGFCFSQEGRYAQAADVYGQASELEPERRLYARDAALAYDRAGQSPQALHFAERAGTRNDADAADHALLGKIYAEAGRKQDAVRELRRAAELNPELDSAFYLLARTYMQMGDRQQAAEWSEKLSALKQRHEAAFNLQKKAEAAPIRSSALLSGGSMKTDESGAP